MKSDNEKDFYLYKFVSADPANDEVLVIKTKFRGTKNLTNMNLFEGTVIISTVSIYPVGWWSDIWNSKVFKEIEFNNENNKHEENSKYI